MRKRANTSSRVRYLGWVVVLIRNHLHKQRCLRVTNQRDQEAHHFVGLSGWAYPCDKLVLRLRVVCGKIKMPLPKTFLLGSRSDGVGQGQKNNQLDGWFQIPRFSLCLRPISICFNSQDLFKCLFDRFTVENCGTQSSSRKDSRTGLQTCQGNLFPKK